MSDRTYAQVIVYDCPEDQRAAVLATLDWARNERPTLDTVKPNTDDARTWRFPDDPELRLGERYGEDEEPLDAYETIAADLIDAAPSSTFRVWVDPKYEYPGMVIMYAPTLGRFEATCDADGMVTVEPSELVAAARAGDTARILQLVGAPWLDAIDALRSTLDAAEATIA
jgi:hypothetical protein